MKKLIAIVALLISGPAFAVPYNVNLNWSDPGEEDSFILQRNPAPCASINSNNWTTIAAAIPANTLTYVDSVNPGTYCYRVAAVKNSLNQGWSNLHEVVVVDAFAPITLSGSQE